MAEPARIDPKEDSGELKEINKGALLWKSNELMMRHMLEEAESYDLEEDEDVSQIIIPPANRDNFGIIWNRNRYELFKLYQELSGMANIYIDTRTTETSYTKSLDWSNIYREKDENFMQAIFPGKNIPLNILDFIMEHISIQYFFKTIEIALSSFKQIKDIEFRLEEDPEVEGSSWVCIDIETEAEEEEVLHWYDNFMDRFISETPDEARQFLRISF